MSHAGVSCNQDSGVRMGREEFGVRILIGNENNSEQKL